MIKSKRLTVTDTATKLTSDRDTGSSMHQSGAGIKFKNTGSNVVYIGGADVTSGGGYAIDANAEFSMELEQPEHLYAICAAGETTTLQVIEGGVA